MLSSCILNSCVCALAGAADPVKSNLRGEEQAAMLLCRLVQTQPAAAMQVPTAYLVRLLLCKTHLVFALEFVWIIHLPILVFVREASPNCCSAHVFPQSG